MSEGDRAVRDLRSNPNVRILVATSAADEGFDLQVANRVVHWDLSSSPAQGCRAGCPHSCWRRLAAVLHPPHSRGRDRAPRPSSPVPHGIRLWGRGRARPRARLRDGRASPRAHRRARVGPHGSQRQRSARHPTRRAPTVR
jgi:hypothetical protein